MNVRERRERERERVIKTGRKSNIVSTAKVKTPSQISSWVSSMIWSNKTSFSSIQFSFRIISKKRVIWMDFKGRNILQEQEKEWEEREVERQKEGAD